MKHVSVDEHEMPMRTQDVLEERWCEQAGKEESNG